MIGARLSSTQRSCRSRNDGGRRSRCPFRSRALARSISSLMSRCVAAGTRSSSSCPSPRRSPRRTTSSSSIGSGPTGRPASTVGRTSVARRTASRGPGRLAAASSTTASRRARFVTRRRRRSRRRSCTSMGRATVASGSTSFGRRRNPSRLAPASMLDRAGHFLHLERRRSARSDLESCADTRPEGSGRVRRMSGR